jgi:two-component system response regulator NreC
LLGDAMRRAAVWQPTCLVSGYEIHFSVYIVACEGRFAAGPLGLFEFEDGLELCEHAVNGQDAIEKAKKFRPDLIILDFSMPVMNGLAAARILKTIMPAVPIILFTIHSKEMFAKEAQNTGINATVSKAGMAHLVKHTRTLLKLD